jgi:acetamidase/formamidase
MKRIRRGKVNEYDITLKQPVIEVETDEKFAIETEDANNGRVQTKNDLPIPDVLGDIERMEFNPLVGPIFVRGVEKGDVLTVSILEIIPDTQGHTLFIPTNNHPLHDSIIWSECRGPYTHIIKHLPGPSGTTSDGKGILYDKVSWNLHPHIGTIAVVPIRSVHEGADSVCGQGPWGGNIDCRDVSKGNRIYLPVYHDGGLLYVGDVHATQADGEIYGVADETRAEVVLSCSVIKNTTIPFLRIEKADSIIQLNVNKPLEVAVTQAFLWLMEWLVREYNMDKREAYLHMGINPDVKINIYQMFPARRMGYTVGVAFPKKNLY